MDTAKGLLQPFTPAGRFSNASTAMFKSYEDLLMQVIQPCCQVYKKLSLPCETAQDEELKTLKTRLEECHQKTQEIMPILKRGKMKAVVFGCTSSGKSSLINAMLENNVLPMSMGVCSSCLVQIEGGDQEEPYLELPIGTKGDVKDLKKLGRELKAGHFEAKKTVVVYWPKSKCKLLNNDILFVDRPDISSDPRVDQIFNDKCDDADVHIFVANSVATITTESKKYFISVANKLSKPNIFFVFNKWDESAHNEEPEKVRQQHIQATKDLMQGLKAEVDEEFCQKKIFFVSAREIVWANLKINENLLLPGHKKRRGEFGRFIKELQISISDSAIKTKFGPHCNEGIALCDRLYSLAQTTCDCLDHAMNEFHERTTALNEKVKQLKAKQRMFNDGCDKITDEAKTMLEIQVREKKDNLRRQFDEKLAKISSEDVIEVYTEIITDTNNKELHSTIKEVVTDVLADIKKDMEDVGLDYLRMPHTTSATGFMLRRPPTSLSDAATKDVRIESPSDTQNKAWYSRVASKLRAFAGSAIAGAGAAAALSSRKNPGPGLLLIGGSVLSFVHYLIKSYTKQQIIETFKKDCKIWLDEQEHTAQITFLTEAEQLADHIKSSFNEKIDKEVDANRNMISTMDHCIQQLKVTSEGFKIYKNSQLKNVKASFEEFQRKYLHAIDNTKSKEESPVLEAGGNLSIRRKLARAIMGWKPNAHEAWVLP